MAALWFPVRFSPFNLVLFHQNHIADIVLKFWFAASPRSSALDRPVLPTLLDHSYVQTIQNITRRTLPVHIQHPPHTRSSSLARALPSNRLEPTGFRCCNEDGLVGFSGSFFSFTLVSVHEGHQY